MFNFKKSVVALLALSSCTVFAGSMGPVCSAVNVTVPCESSAWDLGAKALYLQPAYSGGDYSYSTVENATGAYQDFNQSWAWGFLVEASYYYKTGSDSHLNWYHIDTSANQTFSGEFTTLEQSTNGVGRVSITPKWDAVNLEFGEHVDFGENINIRFHGGAQYARITLAITEAGTGELNGQAATASLQSKPTYNGLGARLGADMSYDCSHGLGAYAHGAAAVLAGTSKISNALVVNSASLSTPNASKATLVPELEAKLGLQYAHTMAQGNLTLDVGWMFVHYFNATQAIENTPTNRAPQVIGGDFGLQGLYFGLNWLGNVV